MAYLPGMRNIKTALAITITAAILTVVDQLTTYEITFFYGAIASLFAVQVTKHQSIKMGIGRIGGTFVGAIVCLIIYALDPGFLTGPEYLPLMFVALVTTIYLVNALKMPLGTTAGCIMVVASFSIASDGFIAYSIIRFLETVLGVIVGLLVNNYIYPYEA